MTGWNKKKCEQRYRQRVTDRNKARQPWMKHWIVRNWDEHSDSSWIPGRACPLTTDDPPLTDSWRFPEGIVFTLPVADKRGGVRCWTLKFLKNALLGKIHPQRIYRHRNNYVFVWHTRRILVYFLSHNLYVILGMILMCWSTFTGTETTFYPSKCAATPANSLHHSTEIKILW